jgi:hypothetical protein
MEQTKRSFQESFKAIREAGGDAYDSVDVEQHLAAVRGQPQGTEARVCDDITERQALGIAKYGKTVEQNNLAFRDWLQHAYEEALDMAIYLKRAIEQINRADYKPDWKCMKCKAPLHPGRTCPACWPDEPKSV